MMRAAPYARVSTPDQHVDGQLHDLRRYVEARGWTLAHEFSDHGVSGTRDRRPGLDALMTAARRREIDVVVVPAFDRFARSVRHLLLALDEFRALGVEFVSLREQVDTSTPLGRMIFTVVAAVAELERELIRERVRLGMAAARRRGTRIGRPPKVRDLTPALREVRAGRGLRAASRASGVPTRTLRRLLRERGLWAEAAAQVAGQDGAEGSTPPTTAGVTTTEPFAPVRARGKEYLSPTPPATRER